MSASRNWDISLYAREKRTLIAFGALYLSLSIGIIALVSVGYYYLAKEKMLQEVRHELNPLANEQVKALQELHVSFDKNRVYPRGKNFNSGIYDADGVQIFSLLNVEPSLSHIVYLKDGMIHYIKEPQMHYLGTRYLVLEIENDSNWQKKAWADIAYGGILALMIFGISGYFLLRLFLRPMREAVDLLDRFIKDTTHELNTPINAILSNIEMIEEDTLDRKLEKRFTRIKIGAQTVANLYQDLTYLTLGHKIVSEDENIELLELCHERVEYIELMCRAKNLKVKVDGEKSYLYIDKKKITKIIDNLLSNAIKYNRIDGSIDIYVEDGKIEICDTGRGVNTKKLYTVFERYTRYDTSVGGFGIGLSIVGLIAKEYGLKISFKSSKEGTCVAVIWHF